MNNIVKDFEDVITAEFNEYDYLSEDINENSHIINLWEPLDFKIDENYEYVPDNIIFKLFSNLLYYGIGFPILSILTKLIYDFKVEGKENIKNLSGNFITVSNHVLFLDCAMVGIALGKRNVYFTTLEGSFKIPFVRKLIKLLKALPIPTKISNKKHFMNAISTILSKNGIVHFYPEASMWPYCNRVRHFKDGAFDFAVKNDVPVVPMVFKFREPKGFRKLFKNKPDVTLKILEPIKCASEIDNYKDKVQFMKNTAFDRMSAC